MSYLVVLAVGFVLYFLYGLSISTRLVITTNIVSIVATLITLAIAFRLRRRVVTA